MSPLYERDAKGALVPTQGDVPEEAIHAIERADEQEIIERLTRADAQPWFAYAWPIKTKEGEKLVIGIGVDGAKEIARQLGNIKADINFKIDERDNHFYCAIPVTDLVRNFTWLGVAAQSKYVLGEGWQPTDRIDEFAFVKVINKAQRNGILGVAPQEAVANIIAKLDPKLIKRLPPPPAYTALPAKARGAAPKAKAGGKETPEEATLRQQVAIAWDTTGKTEEQRKTWQKKTYGADSMTDMNAEQLTDMLDKVKIMVAAATNLGFASPAEQENRRGDLFKVLKQLGHDTPETQKHYLQSRQIDSRLLTKSQIDALIAELSQSSLTKEADNIPEDI